MNLRGSFFAFLTVATMIVSPLAYAATTSTVMPFPTPTITNPCNGEDVNVSGNVHMTIGVTTDGNGGRALPLPHNKKDGTGGRVGTGKPEHKTTPPPPRRGLGLAQAAVRPRETPRRPPCAAP